MEPFQIVIGAVMLVVGIGVVAALVLIRSEDRRSAPVPVPPSVTNFVEAPEHVRVFYLLNGDLVLEQYRQTPGAQVQQQSIEQTQQRNAGVTVGGPVGGQFGASSGGKIQTQFAPTNDPVQAVGVVERHLQSDGQLRSFDLTAQSDNGPIENLLTGLGSDAGRIGLTVPDEVGAVLRRAWREHRQRIPDDLESLGSLYVRLRAEFAVTPGTADGDRTLTVESHHDSGPLEVRIDCRSAHLREAFPRTSGRLKATCFGVPTWDGESRVLTVEPLSIHRS